MCHLELVRIDQPYREQGTTSNHLPPGAVMHATNPISASHADATNSPDQPWCCQDAHAQSNPTQH